MHRDMLSGRAAVLGFLLVSPACTNMATTSFTSVGNSADSPDPFLSRYLSPAMLPKFSTYTIYIWTMMLKNFHISSPNRRLDPHLAQGCWEGYVGIFPYT
jgi:hypothetical protein